MTMLNRRVNQRVNYCTLQKGLKEPHFSIAWSPVARLDQNHARGGVITYGDTEYGRELMLGRNAA